VAEVTKLGNIFSKNGDQARQKNLEQLMNNVQRMKASNASSGGGKRHKKVVRKPRISIKRK
jgi:hypothetical protein